MLKESITLLFGIVLFIGCNSKFTQKSLVRQFVNNSKNHYSLSYDINYKIKHFGKMKDTTKIFAKVDLIKISKDSIFGGCVWINSDSVDRYYNTKNLYIIYHKEKVIIKYDKNETFAIKGKSIGEVINTYFLNSKRLTNIVNDSINTSYLRKKHLYNNSNEWILHFDFPNNQYFENSWKTFWIDQDSLSIRKIAFSVDMQGENQYNEWNIKNIKYNKVNLTELENRFLKYKKNYIIKNHKRKSMDDMSPLHIGTHFPELEGELYGKDTTVSLEDLEGSIVMLDFWYMDCPHCLKAIPYISKLYKNHSNDGLKILSVNPFNNNEKDLSRLPNFLKKNQIEYPILFIDKNTTKKYNVFVYPTFYLIDRKGNVLFSELGFTNELEKKIDSLIKTNL